MRYYVVSDVHGYYTYLENALKKAGFFQDANPHKLIFCGDLLDRGSQANQLIDFMLELMEHDMLIFIYGNHEELFIQCLQELARGGIDEIAGGISHHYFNKTWDTLLQISEMSEREAYNYPHELVRRVMSSTFYRQLLPTCVDYYETPHYVFTHGWIPFFEESDSSDTKCKTYNPNWRNADTDSWRRARWCNGMEAACKYHIIEPNKTIVCGHWHTSYGHAYIQQHGTERGSNADFSPFYADGIIAIDGSTPHSLKVNCIIIDD